MIVLVRHPPAAIAPGICYGRLDLSIGDPGAAADLAARLAGTGGRVWTSPSRRCRAVAEALGDFTVDARLLELDFGEWEGRAWDDVPRAALDRWAADPWAFAAPGGESGAALVARVRSFSAGLRQGDHVVIAHGGPLKLLAQMLRGERIDLLGATPALGSVTQIG